MTCLKGSLSASATLLPSSSRTFNTLPQLRAVGILNSGSFAAVRGWVLPRKSSMPMDPAGHACPRNAVSWRAIAVPGLVWQANSAARLSDASVILRDRAPSHSSSFQTRLKCLGVATSIDHAHGNTSQHAHGQGSFGSLLTTAAAAHNPASPKPRHVYSPASPKPKHVYMA